MAHFYGSIQGQRGEVTRLGSKTSGLSIVAASWQGCVRVELSEQDGIDIAHVNLTPWHGHATNHTLYLGPVSGLGSREAAD